MPAAMCDNVVAFVDGELDEATAQRFRDHLPTCKACRAAVVETVQLAARLSTLEPK